MGGGALGWRGGVIPRARLPSSWIPYQHSAAPCTSVHVYRSQEVIQSWSVSLKTHSIKREKMKCLSTSLCLWNPELKVNLKNCVHNVCRLYSSYKKMSLCNTTVWNTLSLVHSSKYEEPSVSQEFGEIFHFIITITQKNFLKKHKLFFKPHFITIIMKVLIKFCYLKGWMDGRTGR